MAHNTLAIDLFLVGSGAIVFALYLLYGHRLMEKNPELKVDINRGFGITSISIGAMGLVLAFELFFLEPIPHWAVELFGGGLAIYSLLLLAGGFTIYTGSGLRAVSYLAALGGVMMFQVANTILSFGLTKTPPQAATLFTLGGLVGLSTVLYTHIPSTTRLARWPAIVTSILAIAFGILSFYIGINALYGHVAAALKPS